MELSTAILSRFIGGQLEIQNPKEEYIFRGEIANVEVVDKTVKVKFVWVAKGKDGYPPAGWITTDNVDYEASTEIYFASDIGSGRIVLDSSVVGEVAVFFPPDGGRLDPIKVEGLKLAT